VRNRGYQEPPQAVNPSNPQIVADAVYHAARDAKVSAIVVFTSTGSSVRLLSRYRPPVRVYAITPSASVARQLAVNYGVIPVLAAPVDSTDEMLAQMERLLIEGGYLRTGEPVVLMGGQPVGQPGSTNLMKLHRLGANDGDKIGAP